LRNTFVLWDKSTGKCLHNFITWKDSRCKQLCDEWNDSFRLKCLQTVSKLIYYVTRHKRYLSASLLKFVTGMVAMRLLWILNKYKHVREAAVNGKVLYGTVDTWLVWKFTAGKVHATDASNACVSGLFDPFQLQWSSLVLSMLNIPESMFPEILPTNGDYGSTFSSLFGVSIPIRAVVGDQQAAMFGECCFNVGDVKCTLGTGSFMNINTGEEPHTSFKGLYPIVGWKLCSGELVYLAEGSAFDTGTTITWAQKLGLFKDPFESSDVAKSVEDTGGVYFVPAFSGLQAPINDPTAVSSFIGISQSTQTAHLVRAILESLAFRVKQIYESMLQESKLRVSHFRVNGGVSKNDFVLQLIADLTANEVQRSSTNEMSCLGAAYLAGLASGFWKDSEELMILQKTQQVFKPENNWDSKYKDVVMQWERAVFRCLQWYNQKL
ncbi:putative glycerol kinase 5-like protein, partial [Leptotrombidium deliense]